MYCWPEPDALNPCEDIMGSDWLRTSVWLVIGTAFLGNTAVLVVLMAARSETSVPRFLMCHLAFADLCMALYLLLLAVTDLRSTGVYFNYAFDWQRGALSSPLFKIIDIVFGSLKHTFFDKADKA